MKTSVTQKLGIQHPIIQGPFGGNFSTVRLAAAVSNLGGLGSFGLQAYGSSDIRRIIGELHAATGQPFPVNLWVSDHDETELTRLRADFDAMLHRLRPFHKELGVGLPDFQESPDDGFKQQMEAVLEARPPVFSFVFGIPPTAILKECRQRGILTIGAATTVDEALSIESAGVDLVFVFVFDDQLGRDLKGDAEGLGGFHAAVGEQTILEFFAVGGFDDGGGLVGADGKNLITGGKQVRFDFDKGRQMAGAVGAPTATVKDEHSTGASKIPPLIGTQAEI